MAKSGYSKVDQTDTAGPEESPRSVAASYSPVAESAKSADQAQKEKLAWNSPGGAGGSLRAYGPATAGSIATEFGFLWRVAWPTAITTLLRAGTQQVTVMFVGV